MLYLITGGAGFIGINYAHRLLKRGEEVVIYDNLSRPGTEKTWIGFGPRTGSVPSGSLPGTFGTLSGSDSGRSRPT
jgi:cation diffusion facilitator CzcD-associated flavoprotein CzcO